MKLFKTNSIDVVNYCCKQFNFELPSVTIAQRSRKHCQFLVAISIGCVTMLFASHLYFVNVPMMFLVCFFTSSIFFFFFC